MHIGFDVQVEYAEVKLRMGIRNMFVNNSKWNKCLIYVLVWFKSISSILLFKLHCELEKLRTAGSPYVQYIKWRLPFGRHVVLAGRVDKTFRCGYGFIVCPEAAIAKEDLSLCKWATIMEKILETLDALWRYYNLLCECRKVVTDILGKIDSSYWFRKNAITYM